MTRALGSPHARTGVRTSSAQRRNITHAQQQRPSLGRPLLRVALTLVVACLGLLATTGPAGASPSDVEHQEWWIGALGLQIDNRDAGGAWQITKGKGVTVAVIDHGVDASVSDLKGALVPGFATTSSGNPDVANDSEGHGTQMAAYIAGRGTGPGILGVAPEAKVLPVDLSGTGPVDDDIADALNRLAGMSSPPDIVNMSLGTNGACSDTLQAAVARAASKGIIVVAAAGNSGQYGNPQTYPADCKGVVAVGAFDTNALPWSGSEIQPYVAIGGPGVDMVCYDKQLQIGSCTGTSNSSAVVSGELALLRAHWPTMSARQLVARLFYAVSPHYKGPGYGEANDVLGYGIAVANRALRQSVPASAPNAVYDALAKVSGSSSSPTSSASSAPASSPGRSTITAGFPGGNNAAGSGGSSSNTGLIIGVVVAAVVVVGGLLLLLLRRRGAGQRVGPY